MEWSMECPREWSMPSGPVTLQYPAIVQHSTTLALGSARFDRLTGCVPRGSTLKVPYIHLSLCPHSDLSL